MLACVNKVSKSDLMLGLAVLIGKIKRVIYQNKSILSRGRSVEMSWLTLSSTLITINRNESNRIYPAEV